jgi:hypothetical protein
MTPGKVEVWTFKPSEMGGIRQRLLHRTTLDDAWCRKTLATLAPEGDRGKLAKLSIHRCAPPTMPTVQLVYFEQTGLVALGHQRNQWVLHKHRVSLRGPVIAIPANIK